MKIYGAILAGGSGTRMKSANLPKQFLEIGGKPVIIHTLEKFLLNDKFEDILVLVPEKWLDYTKEIITKYIGDNKKIKLVCGGVTRNDTIMNGIDFIKSEHGVNNDDIIITHDSVRPFITNKIIEDNISAAIEAGACDTVICATDTIVHSLDNEFIEDIPNRNLMYQGQTPQSFNIKLLEDTYNSLTLEEKDILTDACKIFVTKNLPVKLVEGSEFNIKLTTPYDLIVADAIYNHNKNNN